MKNNLLLLVISTFALSVFAKQSSTKRSCFEEEYKRVSVERELVGAVMTSDIEEDIRNQCAAKTCFDKEYKRVSVERESVGAVMTSDIEEDIRNQCAK